MASLTNGKFKIEDVTASYRTGNWYPHVTIDTSTDISERACSGLIQKQGMFKHPTVIECTRISLDGSDEERGVFIKTDQESLLVTKALIGYNGSGPSLTKVLFAMLDLPEQLFDNLQRLAAPKDQRYAFRVTLS